MSGESGTSVHATMIIPAGAPDGQGEIIAPGLRIRLGSPQPPVTLEDGTVVGAVEDVRMEADGIHVVARISPRYSGILSGHVDGLHLGERPDAPAGGADDHRGGGGDHRGQAGEPTLTVRKWVAHLAVPSTCAVCGAPAEWYSRGTGSVCDDHGPSEDERRIYGLERGRP